MAISLRLATRSFVILGMTSQAAARGAGFLSVAAGQRIVKCTRPANLSAGLTKSERRPLGLLSLGLTRSWFAGLFAAFRIFAAGCGFYGRRRSHKLCDNGLLFVAADDCNFDLVARKVAMNDGCQMG